MLISEIMKLQKGDFIYNAKTGEKLKFVSCNPRYPFVKVRRRNKEKLELCITSVSKNKRAPY